MNLSGYAKYRKVSAEAVRLAILDGRLKTSIRDITPAGGKNKKYEIDEIAADLEWEANTDSSKRFNVKHDKSDSVLDERPPDSAGSSEPSAMPSGQLTMKQAQALDTEYSARLRALKLSQEMGKLVDVEAVKNEWLKMITEAKTKLLALPVKAKANLPHLTASDVSVLDRLMREILTDIADAGA